jgi:zinc finger FYVE domain-containing protein 26
LYFLKKCNSDIFIEFLLVPCLRAGNFYQLLELMLSMERSQSKFYTYYAAIGKYLEKNLYLNTLYDFQLLMKDYVRACMSCICFFTRNAINYADLYNNIGYLSKARKHLEQYLEICTIKQFSQNAQAQQFSWKQQRSEQQNLCKQMPTQEVDK